jgi:hypothetical protein
LTRRKTRSSREAMSLVRARGFFTTVEQRVLVFSLSRTGTPKIFYLSKQQIRVLVRCWPGEMEPSRAETTLFKDSRFRFL